MSSDVENDDVSDNAESSKNKVQRPLKVLPTNRMAVSKQFDTLRAFGAASKSDGRAVTNVEVSKIVGLHQATIGLAVSFFVDIGLLSKTADGTVPAPEVVEFTHAYDWSPDTAAHRLGPLIQKSWFAQALLPKLRFGPLSDEGAISELAMVSKAAPVFRGQLETLLDYLTNTGVVIRDGNQIRLAKPSGRVEPTEEKAAEQAAPSDQRAESVAQQRGPAVGTSFSGSGAGVVQFNISVKVDMTEFAGWSPDRITAFFSGIAQVLAAKGSIEEGVSRQF